VTEHRCLYCGCDRLTAAREDVELGSVIICGGCSSLMVVDVEMVEGEDMTLEIEHRSPTVPLGRAYLRRLTSEESRAAHADPEIRAILDAYHLVTLEQAGATKPRKKARSLRSLRPGEEYTPGPITIRGPDAR